MSDKEDLEKFFEIKKIPNLGEINEDEYNRLFEEGQRMFILAPPICVKLKQNKRDLEHEPMPITPPLDDYNPLDKYWF